MFGSYGRAKKSVQLNSLQTSLIFPPAMAQNPKIIQLRDLIQRHLSAPVARPAACLETGVRVLDEALAGGLPKGGFIEIVSSAPGLGGSSLLLSLLRQAAGQHRWSALIDGRDSFDPASAGEAVLAGLLWIRCRTAAEAMRSADLLLRDGNLPLVVLDLRDNPDAELRRIPDPQWYRLQRALEPTATAALAFTSRAMIPCAQARLLLTSHLSLDALESEQEAIVRTLRFELSRQRASHNPEVFAQAG
jgi:hypothetical protein